MKHYIAVLCPDGDAGWEVHFPDFPNCRAHGHVIERAIDAALWSVVGHMAQLGNEKIPEPRSLEAIRADEAWARRHGIDWSRCVFSMVRPPAPLASE